MRLIPRSSRFATILAAAIPAFSIAVSLLGVAPRSAQAQLPQIRMTALFPAGGQAGSTFDVQVLSGTDLDEADRFLFNHPGIKAAPKMQESAGRQVPVANTFVVTVEGNVPPGIYEVRVGGLYGVSNPRSFVVDTRPEVREAEPNNEFDKPMPIELNSITNAQSNAGADIDFYKFAAKKGQRIIASVRAQRIDSRMVPVIELYTAAGRRLQYVRHSLREDAVLDFTADADADYILKIYDFVYGGGADYVYRLLLHTGPFIDYVFPPAGLPGTTGAFTLFGRNLPGGQPSGVTIDGRPLEKLDVQIPLPADNLLLQPGENLKPVEAGTDGISYVLNSPAGPSNPVNIYFATGPVTLEKEPNNTPQQSQPIAVPGEFAGQFQERGDIDHVTFEAKAQEVYWLEVFGQRTGSRAHAYMVLQRVTKNEKGEETVSQIAAQDGTPTNLSPVLFDTISDDSAFRFVVPADGTYRVVLRDRYFESRGEPQLLYRLSIVKEDLDFRVVAIPNAPVQPGQNIASAWSLCMRRGDNLAVDVFAFRRHGFNGTIDIAAEGLPAGVTCPAAAIGPGQNGTTLVFASAENAQPWYGEIKIVGKARIEDPAKKKAVDDAKAALKVAQDALPKVREEAQKQADSLKAANEKLKAADEAAKKNTDDKNLAKLAEDAKKAVDAAAAVVKTADDAKAAAETKAADAQQLVAKSEAEFQAAIRSVARPARPATIVQNGDANNAAVTRLARSLTLAVTNEIAPYQVVTDVTRVEANQNRQILVPVRIHKRNDFDNNVTLQFAGQPQNAQLVVRPINKGKDEDIFRIFIPNNTPEGTYTLTLQSNVQVSYRRNPEKADLLKAEADKVTQEANAAAEAAKQAVAARDAANKQAADADAAMKKATTDKDAAAKVSTDAAAVAKKAEEAKAASDKAFTDADAAAKAAAKKAEEAKKAADAAKDNKELQDASAAADKASADAAAAAKKAEEAKTAADKALTDAQAAAKTAADALAAAEKTLADATAANKAAQEAKTKAEQEVAATDAKSKASAAAKAAADKAAADAATAAQPKPVNVFEPSTAIVLDIRKTPANPAANVPNGGNLKIGQKLDVKVTVNRANGFAGPVELSLPLPPYVKGLTAAPVTIPADQNEGVLSIEATGEAVVPELKTEAEKKAKDAEEALKKAVDEKTKADKAAQDARTKATAAAAKLEAATKAAAADANNKPLQDAKAAAEKEAADASAAAKTAVDAQAAADKAHADARTAAEQAARELTAVELALAGYGERMVIRATMDFDGKAAVDAPIKLNVTK